MAVRELAAGFAIDSNPSNTEKLSVSTYRYFLTPVLIGLIPVIANCASPPSQASLGNPESLNETAPDVFRARFETSAGDFVVQVNREWAPEGADRFYNLVKNGFYDDCRFFRVIEGFMVQFGINGEPAIQSGWVGASIPDDPVQQSNRRGYVTYAMSGAPNSRTTQIFINFADNSGLDASGFAPFGQIVEGMSAVDSIYSGYGEGAPRGRGPEQGRIQTQGNAYLESDFPELDYVIRATIAE
jgi:peptidyl-prolyl cis-trans isomerase A (cyclophilin A)